MARNNDRDRGTNQNKRAPKDDKRRPLKKKASPIREGAYVDYKDINLLRKFTSERGKIRARRVTGLSVQLQREVANAVKVARELALLPYAAKGVAERGPRRPRTGGKFNEGDSNENAEVEVDDSADADVDEVDDVEEGE
jgi:small subunit ribosomal protein S18